jgi:membrane associated rhomboid family serine protease
MTRWVARLIAANLAVLLLLATVFTAPEVTAWLRFDATHAFVRPWTFVSHLFVHTGLLHLLLVSLVLLAFGPAVESRMGSKAFILYYFYCGVGAALLATGLSGIASVAPFAGSAGASLGVAFAFAAYWPDARVVVFPLPVALRARPLVVLLGAASLVVALLPGTSEVVHVAHVGGIAAGYAYFRLQALSRRPPPEPSRAAEPVVMVQSAQREPVPAPRNTPVTPLRPRRRIDSDPVAAEVDRVLDKISQKGLESLTPAERRFLDEVSRKKRET